MRNLANFAYVYQVKVTNSIYFLPGISFGIGSKNLILDNLILEDQLDQASGFINSESRDPLSFQINNVNYVDLGASFILHNDTFLFGLALKHLNRPNTDFSPESRQSLPIGYVINGAYEFNVNPFEKVYFPKHSFLLAYASLTKLGKTYRMFLSQELQLGEFSIGVNQQMSYLQNFSMNNFGISVGLSLENFDIGLIYDFGVKNVNKVFAPGVFELYLTFDFSKFRRNSRGLFKRLQTDNYF